MTARFMKKLLSLIADYGFSISGDCVIIVIGMLEYCK